MSKSNPQTWKKVLKRIEIFLANKRDRRHIFHGQSKHSKKLSSFLHHRGVKINETKQEPWKKVLKKIDVFLADNRDQHYIFRGQSSYTEKIRSALHRDVYRDNEDADTSNFSALPDSLEHKQQSLLLQMKDLFFPGEHELEILTQLQHLGEPTNFIDFTYDYHVALFFACSTPEKSSSNPVIYFYHANKDDFTDKNDVKLSKKMAKGNYIFRPQPQQPHYSTACLLCV